MFDNELWNRIPEHCQQGLRDYVERGVPVGGFLTAVLENDFLRSFSTADEVNRKALAHYAHWIYNEAPNGCHGSPKKVTAWIAHGGLFGHRSRATNEKM